MGIAIETTRSMVFRKSNALSRLSLALKFIAVTADFT